MILYLHEIKLLKCWNKMFRKMAEDKEVLLLIKKF
jgi:hypothetical protein